MRYVLKLEAIGDNHAAFLRQYNKFAKTAPERTDHIDISRLCRAYQLGGKGKTPWVAQIVGLDAHLRLMREFVRGQKDYSEATTSGSRGIHLYYALKPGIYEVNDRVTWGRVERYFCRVVDDKTLDKIPREEVMRCLRNAA